MMSMWFYYMQVCEYSYKCLCFRVLVFFYSSVVAVLRTRYV